MACACNQLAIVSAGGKSRQWSSMLGEEQRWLNDTAEQLAVWDTAEHAICAAKGSDNVSFPIPEAFNTCRRQTDRYPEYARFALALSRVPAEALGSRWLGRSINPAPRQSQNTFWLLFDGCATSTTASRFVRDLTRSAGSMVGLHQCMATLQSLCSAKIGPNRGSSPACVQEVLEGRHSTPSRRISSLSASMSSGPISPLGSDCTVAATVALVRHSNVLGNCLTRRYTLYPFFRKAGFG